MPINAEDFYNSATETIKDNSSEVYCRNAVSRTYYSMYHKVLSILDKEPLSYPGKGVHGSLITYLESDAANDESIDFMKLKALSYMLRQVRERRVCADYKLEEAIALKDAEESINMAKRFIDKCDSLTCGYSKPA